MNFFQKHLQHTDTTQLTHAEKSAMRSALFHAMGLPVPSPYFSFFTRRFVRISSTALVLILVAGTTSYAAQGSLPGDLLYPVKTDVNEKLESALATSDEAKAQLNVNLAVERVQEAEQLAVVNRLSSTTAAQIQANFDAHTREASDYTKRVSKRNALRADEISAQFSTSLETRAAALGKLDELESPSPASTSTPTANANRTSKKFSDHIRARAAEIQRDMLNNEQPGEGLDK